MKFEKEISILPTSDAWESLDEKDQEWLQYLADEISNAIRDGEIEMAVKHLLDQKLESDYYVAIWTRFDSKERSAMKKEMRCQELTQK